MIGLTGPHRSGKTTLAREFAKKHGLEFIPTSASQVFEEMGLDPVGRYDFATRLDVQEEILKRADALYSRHAKVGMAITDRTPLDFLAYTLADAVQYAVPHHLQGRFDRYVQDCIDVTNRRFSVLLVVQPGIPLVAEEGKAALSRAYIEHLNSLVLGLSVDERISAAHFYIPRYMTDLDDRIEALEFAIARGRKRAAQERDGLSVH